MTSPRPPDAGTAMPPSPAPHGPGQTTPQSESGERKPKLPHEQDESSSSQDGAPRDVMRQAHSDLQSGQVDTDRGPVTDELYEKQVRPPGDATAQRGKPASGPASAQPKQKP